MSQSQRVADYIQAYPVAKILNKTAPLSISLQDETDCFAALANLTIPDGILTGLGLSISGPNVLVAPGTWKIDGLNYGTLITTSIPFDPQDDTYSRYDVLYVDDNNQINLVSGALSLTPFEPAIPDGTIKIGSVLITPTQVTLNNPVPTDYVNTTGNQNVGGLKNFMDGIQSVTMPLGDNSINVATTSWVQGELDSTAYWFTEGTFVGSGTELDPWSINVANVRPDGIISGLGSSISGSNVVIASGSWSINGMVYTTGTTHTLALDAQDITLSRYDSVFVNSASTFSIVSGTLSATPTQPSTPTGNIRIADVLITPTSVTAFESQISNYVTTNTDQTVSGNKTFIAANTTIFQTASFYNPIISVHGDVNSLGLQMYNQTPISFTSDANLSHTWFLNYDSSFGGLAFTKSGQPAITFKDGGIIQRNIDSALVLWSTDPIGSGSVTSVSGVAANGFTWSIANASTTPAITLTLQNASTSQAGQLTSADWNTFNSKQAALSGTGFVKSTGGTISYDTNTYLTTSTVASTYQTLANLQTTISASATQYPSSTAVQNYVTGLGYITSASLPAGANPSANIGLSAVNGSATTFMRSDAAPALSQSITPTWTGAHKFTSNNIFSLNATTVTPIFGSSEPIQLIGANSSDLVFEARTFVGHFLLENWRANGTAASPTVLNSGDELMAIGAGGYSGVGTNGGYTAEATAALQYIASQNWTSTANGTYALMNVTPNGSTTLTASVKFDQDLSLQVKGNFVAGQFEDPNVAADPAGYASVTAQGSSTSTNRGVFQAKADINNTSNTVGEYRFVADYNSGGYIIARTYSGLSGATANNKGGTWVGQTKVDGGALATFMQANSDQTVQFPHYTTNGGLFYGDATGNLKESGAITGIIKGNGTSAPTAAVSNTDYLPVASPVMTTPTLGAATATSINGNTFTTGTYTLTGAAGKTLTFNNSLTLSGTDSSTLNIGTGGTLGTNAYTSTAYVPQTTTVAGFALSGNVTLASLTATDTTLTLTGTPYNGSAAASFGINLSRANTWNATITATAFLTSAIGGNFANGSNGGASASSNAANLWGGAANNFYRILDYGSGSSALTTGANYTAFQVGQSPITTFSSGNNDLAQVEINSFGTITNGGGTINNTYMLRVENAATAGTANYVAWYGTGSFHIDGLTASRFVQSDANKNLVSFDLFGTTNTWTAVQTFGNNISIGGVTSTGATGTGNNVFSIAPTFTGMTTLANFGTGNGIGAATNFYTQGGASATSTTNAASLIGGATEVFYRTGYYGNTSTQINPNDSYASVLFATTPVTTGSSGTSAILAGLAIKAISPTITGGSAVTSTASLYIEGQASGATNNFGLLLKSANLGFAGSTSGFISVTTQAAAGTYNYNLPTTAGTSGFLLTSAGGGASPMTWTSNAGLLVWSEISTTTQTIAARQAYIATSTGGTQLVFTLPATAAVGDLFSIVGNGSGGWKIAQNASQIIKMSGTTTTSGTGGSVTSGTRYDAVEIICVVTNTTFAVRNSQGTLTLV